jgi:hypothetical protein
METSGFDQHTPRSEDATDRPGGNGLPNRKESEGEDELIMPQNPSGSTSTPMNPQQSLTASTPLPTLAPTPPVAGLGPMVDLSLDIDDIFGPDFPNDMHLWFDPTAFYENCPMPDLGETTPRFDPVRKNNPWFDPIVVHAGPSLDTTLI